MSKNHLIICLRNFKREKGYTAINILGLTVTITCGLFLYLYVPDELSFDCSNSSEFLRFICGILLGSIDTGYAYTSTPIDFPFLFGLVMRSYVSILGISGIQFWLALRSRNGTGAVDRFSGACF